MRERYTASDACVSDTLKGTISLRLPQVPWLSLQEANPVSCRSRWLSLPEAKGSKPRDRSLVLLYGPEVFVIAVIAWATQWVAPYKRRWLSLLEASA